MTREENHAVIVTEACDLRCRYCYVDKGRAKTMTAEVADALPGYVFRRLEHTQSVALDLFGGEALLKWGLCKKIIGHMEYVNSGLGRKAVRVSVYSNMVAVTEEQLLFCRDHGVRFNISLDGGRACHNKQRVFPDGSGSFDAALAGIRRYAAVYRQGLERIPVKFMLTPGNIREARDGVLELYGLGFRRISTGMVKEPVWGDGDIEAFGAFYRWEGGFMDRTAKAGAPFVDLHFLTPYFDRLEGRRSFCSAGRSRFAVAPNGSVYPCQRLYNSRIGPPIGDVWSGMRPDSSVACALAANGKTGSQWCRRCEHGLYGQCNGQCFAAILESGEKDATKPIGCVCRLLKAHHDACMEWVEGAAQDRLKAVLDIYKK